MDQKQQTVKHTWQRGNVLEILSHGPKSKSVLYGDMRAKYGHALGVGERAISRMALDGLITLTWFCRDGDKDKLEWIAEITPEGRKALQEFRFKRQKIKAYRWRKVKIGNIYAPRWYRDFRGWTAYVESRKGKWIFCLDAPMELSEDRETSKRVTSGWIESKLQTELGAKQEAIATLLRYAGQDGLQAD